MAEKKTLFILETIKKKMNILDRKSDTAASATTPIGDEFEYIAPPKKIDSEQIAQEEKKHEDQIAQFEDDLGIDDDHLAAPKVAAVIEKPEVQKAEEHKYVAPEVVMHTPTPEALPTPPVAAPENKPAETSPVLEVDHEKHDDVNAIQAALDQARAAESAAAAKAAMGISTAASPAQVAAIPTAPTTPPSADDLAFAEEEDPFATTTETVTAAPVEQTSVLENKAPEVLPVEETPIVAEPAAPAESPLEEDADPFAEEESADFEDAAEPQAQIIQEPAAPVEQAQIVPEIKVEETPAALQEAASEPVAAPEEHEFDFSDLEKDDELPHDELPQSELPQEPVQVAPQAALTLPAAPELAPEIVEQKSEITIDHFIADKQLDEAKEAVNQLLAAPSQVAEEVFPDAVPHDLDAEFEKEMMSFVPQNSAVNNFQRIPQFDARKQSASSSETSFVMSGKAAKQASDSIQRLLDTKKSQEAANPASAQEVAVSNELIEAKLGQWIDKNLPGIVDRIVREEIQKLMNK